jgi:hypothetical protein
MPRGHYQRRPSQIKRTRTKVLVDASCEHCQGPFKRARKSKRYCSPGCKQQAKLPRFWRVVDGVMLRLCPECNIEKPTSDFPRSMSLHWRRLGPCKTCKWLKVKDNPHYKEVHCKNVIRSQKRHPVKDLARRAVGSAVKRGKLVPQPCEVCGAEAQAHHEDYTKPLEVRWLCYKHHKTEHHQLTESQQY